MEPGFVESSGSAKCGGPNQSNWPSLIEGWMLARLEELDWIDLEECYDTVDAFGEEFGRLPNSASELLDWTDSF
jgi:hypothetical protein